MLKSLLFRVKTRKTYLYIFTHFVNNFWTYIFINFFLLSHYINILKKIYSLNGITEKNLPVSVKSSQISNFCTTDFLVLGKASLTADSWRMYYQRLHRHSFDTGTTEKTPITRSIINWKLLVFGNTYIFVIEETRHGAGLTVQTLGDFVQKHVDGTRKSLRDRSKEEDVYENCFTLSHTAKKRRRSNRRLHNAWQCFKF